MIKYKIILSGGSMPWMNLKQSLKLVEEIGYGGVGILPTRRVAFDIKNSVELNLLAVHSIHQSWRLDNSLNKKYGISFLNSLLLKGIGYIFFPSIGKSNSVINLLISRKKI